MYTFKKQERVCSRKVLDKLFSEGNSFLVFPFRITYLLQPTITQFPAQVVFSVSKKRFKRAHDRNRLKRLMREVYRLNKPELYKDLVNNNLDLIISINYIASEEIPFQQFQLNFSNAITKLKSLIFK